MRGLRLLLATFLVAATARAQIVNVQPLVAAQPRRGFSAVVEGSADWRTGNARLLLVSGNAVGRLNLGRHLLFLFVRGDVGLKDGNRFIGRHLEHLRWRFLIRAALDGEIFAQVDGDEFRRLGLRTLGGAGPRLRLITSRVVDAAVAVAYMFEYERLRDGPEPDARYEVINHRLSAYAVIAVHLGDRFRVGQTTYLQPRLTDPGDVRILSETELLVGVTSHVALKSALTIAFDSLPPAGVHPVDTALRSTLQVNF